MSTIMIVDEHPIARHALRLLLESEGHTIVAESSNGTEALEVARRLRPNLLLLELSIPGLGGLEIIQRLARQAPEVRILVVTGQSSEYFAARSHEAGAFGFISKQTDLKQVGMAVKALLNGHTYFPRDTVLAVPHVQADKVEDNPLKALSARELTVLQMLAKGMTNNVIGERLLLSEKTISTYKTRVMHKLRAGSMLELFDIARRYGLVETTAFSDESPRSPLLDEAHQRELDLMHEIIDALPHALCVRDLEGRLITCNSHYLEQHSLKLEDVVGRRMYETQEWPEEHARYIHERLVAEMLKGQPYSVDVVLKIRGEDRVLRHWGKPYRDSAGNLLGLICGNVDVTDRDGVLLDLRDSSTRLEVAIQAKERFMEWVTDEMTAPLNNIAAMLDLASGPLESAKQAEAIAIAQSATQGMQKLLEDFRSYLRLEAGKHALTPELVDVKVLTQKLVNEFQPSAQARGLSLQLDTVGSFQTSVWLDPHAFTRITQALLSNALRFTDRGGVSVELRCIGLGQGLVKVELMVRDTGIGIPEEDQGRMFEAFSQRLDDLRIRRGGSGIGLALCKRLVERMNGQIELISNPGEGTCVSAKLILPAVK